MGKPKTTGTVHDYLAGLAAGLALSQIGAKHGVTPNAVHMALKRAGLPAGMKAYAKWAAEGGMPPPLVVKQPHNKGVAKPNVLMLDMRMIHSRCEEEGDCLLWVGAVNDGGLPYASHGGRSVNVRRLVWQLAHPDTVLPPHMVVSPRCGHGNCLNPEHLPAMTRPSMARKLSAQGAYSRPEANAARLAGRRAASKNMSMEKAREIRLSSLTARDEAKRVGLSVSMVHLIRQNKCWAEVPEWMPANSVFSLGRQGEGKGVPA